MSLGTHAMAVVALLCMGACTRPGPPPAPVPSISGHWRTTGGPDDLDMTLWVKGDHVGGSGTLREANGRTTNLAVQGQFTYPSFLLRLMVRDRVTAEFAGVLDSLGTLRGVMRAPGVAPSDTLILGRLPLRP